MTTNKPDVKKYTPESGYDSVMRKTNWMREEECGLYVSLSDYEALQLDRDQQYQMKVRAREQRDAVTQKMKSLQAECEKLRKDAERYRHLRDRLTAPTLDNLFFLELYSAGAFDHPYDVDEEIDAAIQEANK